MLGRLATRHALFTLGVAASVIGFGAWIVLAFMLYRLMSSSGRFLGLLMVIFTVSGVAMNWIALSHLLPLVTSASSGMDPGTLAPIVGSYNRVLLLANILGPLAAPIRLARCALAYRAAGSGLLPLHRRL